jgi:monoamine oxidase
LDKTVKTPEVRELMDVLIRGFFAVEPAQVSFLFLLFSFKGAGSLEAAMSVEGGAQQDGFVGGAHRIAQQLAERLGDAVVVNAPVRAIRQDKAGVHLISDRGNWRADYAIVAVPPALAARIDYSPILPPMRDALTQRMPMGQCFKCLVLYETPFWRKAGLSGAALRSDAAVGHWLDLPLQGTQQGGLVGFSCGESVLAWSGLSREDRQQRIVAELVDLFGPLAAHPVDYIDRDWTAAQWSRGAYSGVMGPGTLVQLGVALRQPCDRLHWAGTETATQWNGYMEGAVRSGDRTATEVLQRLAVSV